MKLNLKSEAIPLVILLIVWSAGIYFYLNSPERVIIHWNFRGEADGYSGRAFGSFFVPVLSSALYLLFCFLPYFDPKKENYPHFSGSYQFFKNLILIFFLAISVVTGFINLGSDIPIGTVMPVLVGALFIALGAGLRNIKQNWFLGFRFPWTLSSETVWTKTHRLGSKVLYGCGIAILFTPLLPERMAMALFIVAVLAMVFVPMIYSLLIFQKEKKVVQG